MSSFTEYLEYYAFILHRIDRPIIVKLHLQGFRIPSSLCYHGVLRQALKGLSNVPDAEDKSKCHRFDPP